MAVDPSVLVMVQLAFAALFAAAAWHKLTGRVRFAAVLDGYGLLPTRLTAPATLGIPAVELAIVGALLAHAPTGLLAASAMLVFYAIIMTITVMRGRTDIDCGCAWGEPSRAPQLGLRQIARNIGLALVALAGLLPSTGRDLGLLDAVNIGAGLVLGFILVQIAASLSRTPLTGKARS